MSTEEKQSLLSRPTPTINGITTLGFLGTILTIGMGFGSLYLQLTQFAIINENRLTSVEKELKSLQKLLEHHIGPEK